MGFLGIHQELDRLGDCSLAETRQSLLQQEPCLCPTRIQLARAKDEIISGTYTALERTTINVIATQLADSHRCVLMGIHLDECEATVRLEAGLNNIAKVLEERYEVVLGGVRSEVTDVACRLPSGSLLDNHVVALDAVGRKVMMTERSGRSHAHSRHGLLLGDGRLSFLIRPIAADGARSKPFTVHGAQSLLRILTLAERNESITSGATSFHIPHDACLRD